MNVGHQQDLIGENLVDIGKTLLGGVDPVKVLETMARFMRETREELKTINGKLDILIREREEVNH